MADVCYKCGIIGHEKSSCPAPEIMSHSESGDLYGPWICTEANAFTVVKEGQEWRFQEEIFLTPSMRI